MNIILDIHLHLPKGFNLIVKEHPSMFRNNFNIRVRFSDFYKNISKLSNVSLASLSIESFDLIDKSNGIITITGTVGLEALLRDRPVLVYGDAQFKNFKNVYNQRDDNQKKSFFDNLNSINPEANISSNSIKDLSEVDKFSFFTEKKGISKKAINKYLHYMFSEKRNEI
jgi:capsule polysaccharide modification protein KpsS